MNSTVMNTPAPSQKWYRQFWPWFLLILPGTVVVASIFTVAISFLHSDTLVKDNYYKEGLAINQQRALDQRAASEGLRARLGVGDNNVNLALAGNEGVFPDHILLEWQHPTDADADFTTVLVQQASNRYYAEMPQIIDGRWYVTIQPFNPATATNWRLKREINLQTQRQFQFSPRCLTNTTCEDD